MSILRPKRKLALGHFSTYARLKELGGQEMSCAGKKHGHYLVCRVLNLARLDRGRFQTGHVDTFLERFAILFESFVFLELLLNIGPQTMNFHVGRTSDDLWAVHLPGAKPGRRMGVSSY